MKPLNHCYQNCKLFRIRLNHYRTIATNLAKNEYVYAICCRPEAASDVISGRNEKTSEGYAVLNFEVASFINFGDIFFKKFRDGGGHQG